MGLKKIAGGLTGCLLILAVLAPAALADSRFTVTWSNNQNGGAQDSFATVYDSAGSMAGTTVQLIRGGSVLRPQSPRGPYPAYLSAPAPPTGGQPHHLRQRGPPPGAHHGLPP